MRIIDLLNKTFWYGHTRNTYFDGYLRKENSFIPTTIELLQAINKQIEELGWLDNER